MVQLFTLKLCPKEQTIITSILNHRLTKDTVVVSTLLGSEEYELLPSYFVFILFDRLQWITLTAKLPRIVVDFLGQVIDFVGLPRNE